MISTSDRLIISEYSDELLKAILDLNPDMTFDNWDKSGATTAVAETLASNAGKMFGSWENVAGYRERQYAWAEKIQTDSEARIARLTNPASAEADALRRAAEATAQNMRNMGDLASGQIPSGVSAAGASSAARAAGYIANAASAAGAALALGQMASATYGAASGEQTTHEVMGTAAGVVGGTGAGAVVGAIGAGALGTALVPAIATAALAVGAAFFAGKYSQEAYNKWGKGLTDFLNDTGRWWGREIYDWLHPDPATRSAFINAQNWRPPRRDPLTLDLDGDGLETVEASATRPILFDHDGDGIRNGTGWVKPDDGFLAMDRNGNGTIDNGSELFGDATALYAGGKAVDGFAALGQEDSNRDGKIDSADARWQQLRVWRDLNQDGLSQAGELFTLDQLGIVSLNVAQVANSQILANGNQIADLGAFTWKNGRSGTMGDVGKMADINLVEDTFYRQYTDPVAVDQAVTALPEVRGSGAVRDLREAASLSPALRDILTQYAQSTTRQEQRALLAPLMQAWADTSGLAGSMQERAVGQYVVAYQAIGTQTRSSPGWAEAVRAWEARMHVLEAFNGRYFFGLPGQSGGASTAVTGLSVTQSVGATPRIDIAVGEGQAALLDQSYDALTRSVYVSLTMQTRFKPVLDQLGLAFDEGGVRLDFSRVEAHFREAIAQDGVNGLADLIDFNRGTREMFAGTGWKGEQVMARYMATLPLTPEMLNMYAQSGVQIAASNLAFGSENADFILTQDAGSQVEANGGNDVLVGRAGNDRLNGGAGNDLLVGGAGNDRLDGGVGNDTYLLARGDGVDLINEYDATPGNKDVVRFVDVASGELRAMERRGDDLLLWYGTTDQLTLANYFHSYYVGYKVEQFQFSDGVVWNETAIKERVITVGSALADTVYGYSDGANRIYGLDGNDALYGSVGNDLLDGGNGNDELSGGAGNDVLNGGAGDDRLFGEAGNDVISGGAGNDFLSGNAGNDIYLLSRGDGADVISDYDATPGNTDVARFADVASTDVTLLERCGNDLVLRYGSPDQLTVELYFYSNSSGYKLEQLQFSDGVVWDEAAIKQRVMTVGSAAVDYISGYDDGANRIYGLDGNDNLSGGAQDDLVDGGNGNDTLYGGKGSDQLYGAAGDDRLYGGTGNDVLVGGTGNDWLGGDEGNDTYVFSRGDGVDVINENDSTPGNTDVLHFADVASTEPTALERRGNDLVLRYGSADQVSVASYFYPGYSAFKVEQFRFSDGVTWDEAAIKQRVMTMGSAAADSLAGYDDGPNRIYGLDGNDGLSGGARDDLLDGGNGNDRLSGGAGNDVLRGGVGDDSLAGGAGSDTYLLARGDGVDMISDYDTTPGKVDVARFTDVASTEVTLLERRGYNLVLRYGTADQLTVENYFHPDFPQYKVDQFQFSDGVVWNDAAIKARVRTVGTASGDSITGYNDGPNRIYGLDGNDYLYGGNGDDLLCGGKGNDRLSGGAGNDIYLLARGDGMDVINNLDTTRGKIDVAQFADVASTEVAALERREDNLVLRYGTPDQLTVERYFDSSAPAYKLERLQFSDGVVWDEAAVKQRVMTVGSANGELIYGYNDGANRILGLGGNDTLYGGTRDDFIDGGVGEDRLYGGSGKDVLNGGVGNDLLSGDAGNDTYLLSRGDGVDVINDYDGTPGNTDVVQFINVASTEVTLLERRGDHLVLRYGTPDQLTIERYFDASYPGYRVERLEFSDGVVWDEAGVKQRVMTMGTASGDGITGYSDAANRIYGLDGNDYLLGGASDDLLEGGNGNDNLSGGGGNDLLNGGNDNDTLSGGAGSDVLNGAAGADSLNDASGNNLFNGGADNDVINGGSGNELYIGGAGNDVISTGSGCDLIAFNRGDGQDVVLASSGQDNAVSLGGGIVAADLSLTKSGADLVLGTGANESITFRDWYASAGNHSVARLQMLDDAAGNDGGAASGPLESGRVAQFDFASLAGRFDQVRTASPELTSWSLSSSLLDFHLGSSDSAAIGGDLGYQYARLGNLSAMPLASAQSLLANAQFGSASQALQASATLQDLSPRLM